MGFGTDQALWYRNGVWGELGYAVPNFGNDPWTSNQNIQYLVDVMGQNLFAVMHHVDADLRTPPSINTLTRVHKLVIRARQIISARAVPPGTPDLEPIHVTPTKTAHLIYPVPYFKVRNPHLKQYCGLMLSCLAEAMQHTENAKSIEFSLSFAGTVSQYLQRIYVMMATELFGIDPATAKAANFTLKDTDLAAYDPSKFFTSTEMVDTVPEIATRPREDDLAVLRAGLPAPSITGFLAEWPTGADTTGNGGQTSGGQQTAQSTGSFVPPPTP